MDQITDEWNIISFVEDLSKTIFEEKKYEKAADILERSKIKFKDDPINFFSLNILSVFCLFQLKNFLKFRETWIGMDHD